MLKSDFDKQSKAFDKVEQATKALSDAWADLAARTAELGRKVADEGHPDELRWCALLNPALARQLLCMEFLKLNKTWENNIGFFPHALPGVNEARKHAARWAVEGWQDLAPGDPKKFLSMRKRLEEQRERLFKAVPPKE